MKNKEHLHTINNELNIERATVKDAEEILALQKLAFTSVAEIYNDYTIAPLTQTLEEIQADFKQYVFLKASKNGAIMGSVKGQMNQKTCYIGRLVVHPDFENRGIGTRLMHAIEADFKQAKRYELFTGHRNERNLYLYNKLGYKIIKSEPATENLTIIHLEKLNNK